MTNAPLIVAGGAVTPLTKDPTEEPPPPPPGPGGGFPPPRGATPPGGPRSGAAPPPAGAAPPGAVKKEVDAFVSFLTHRPPERRRPFEFKVVGADLADTLNRLAARDDLPAIRAVADELTKHSGAEGGTPADHVRTISHLADTMATNIGHARRHLDEALDPSEEGNTPFNARHARKHLDEAAEHSAKLVDFIAGHPELAGEWLALQDASPDTPAIRRSAVEADLPKARARRGRAKSTPFHKAMTAILAAYVARIVRAFTTGGPLVTGGLLSDLYRDAWVSGVVGAHTLAGVPPPPVPPAGDPHPDPAVLLDSPVLGEMIAAGHDTAETASRNWSLIAAGLTGGALASALASRAELVVATEGARAQAAGANAAYAALEVAQRMFLTAGDDLVDAPCAENEDVGPIGIDEDFPNGPPPLHPNCRCVVVPVTT